MAGKRSESSWEVPNGSIMKTNRRSGPQIGSADFEAVITYPAVGPDQVIPE